MADLPPPGRVTCPLCDKVCNVPSEGSDSLPNNLHALHMVELKKALTECENTVTARDNAITTLKSTITSLSNTNTKLNNILENGQLVFVAIFNSCCNFLTKSQYFFLI